MGQYPTDDGGIGDHGHDPHRAPAARTRERVHLEDLAEQLRPAEPGCAERPVDRVDDRNRRLGRVVSLAPPDAPGSAGVPAVVALHHLAGIGDVGDRRARNSSGATVAVPAVGPSALSER